MKTAIIYKSKTGFTKKYADWIAQELSADIFDAAKISINSLKEYGTIIYGGGLYAGGINGIKLITKNIDKLEGKKIIVFATGASPGRKEIIDEVKDKNISAQQQKLIKFFYVRGGFDYNKLGPIDKLLMKMLKRQLKGKDPEKLTADERGMLAAYDNPVDFTRKKYLEELLAYVKPSINIVEYYEKSRREILENCNLCGLCYQECSLNGQIKTDYSPAEIQRRVLAFLKDGTEDDAVYARGFSCLQCFKCAKGCCPQGLNPLLINELIKWDYRNKGTKIIKYIDAGDKESPQRVLSSVQIPKDDLTRITQKTEKRKAKYVFFPGCNVYYQPEKILSARDIIELITDDCAYIPGLDYCCGSVYIQNGDLEKARTATEKFIKEIAAYEPETVILWCPTCLCRYDITLSKVFEIPYKVLSFPQFVAENINKLEFRNQINKTLTLHEACKTAFTDLDLNGTREILQHLPGADLVEMKRSGKDTVCCGLGALNYSVDILEHMRDERLKEAQITKADILIDVCHACHKLFIGREKEYEYEIKNIVTLLAQALGIAREDKLMKYIQLNDLNSILEDIKNNKSESPFANEIIIQKIKENVL